MPSQSGLLWQYCRNWPGFLEIGVFACASRTRLLSDGSILRCKVLPRFGIAAADNAVGIVAYQAVMDVQSVLRQTVLGFAPAYGLGETVLVLGGGFRLHGGIPSGTRLIIGDFGDFGFEFGKRREIKIAFQQGGGGIVGSLA